MEKYSCLLSLYKNEKKEYLILALDSMINQTYPPDEIVLVEDGELTPELYKVLDDYNNKYPGLFKFVINEKNLGLGLSLNRGLAVCKNELVARMDTDDFSLPQRCELQIKAFEENPSLDIIGCSVKEFKNDINNIIGERTVPFENRDIYKFAKYRDPFNHPTVMFRKSKVIESGGYLPYRKNQDTDLWIRMLQHNAVCKNLTEDLFRFRFDDGTYKKRKSWVNTKILIEIRFKAFKSGFNTFFEFLIIFWGQILVYLLPQNCQEFIYKRILRKK